MKEEVIDFEFLLLLLFQTKREEENTDRSSG